MGIAGQKRRFNPDARAGGPDAGKMGDRGLRRVDAAPAGGQDGGCPEWAVRVFPAFHLVADIGGMVGGAALINNHRQIATVANRIHRHEKNKAVAAQQILDVVLGCHQQHVQPRRLHQAVNTGKVGLAQRRKVGHGCPLCVIHLAVPDGILRRR